MCSEYCEGEDFFGIQYGSECWCGSASDDEDVFRHGSATCEYPCAGDDEQTCGGYVAKMRRERVMPSAAATRGRGVGTYMQNVHEVPI